MFTALFIAIVVGFVGVAVVVTWAGVVMFFRARITSRLRWIYIAFVAVAAAAAYLSTYRYDYFTNENTHFFGWPISHSIFQRDSPTSDWLDYVGPTALLAYPMNFSLYLLLPSIAFLLLTRRSEQSQQV